jgi:putative transcriptional regulator
MDKDLFNQLTESIKQAGKISRGEMKPGRMFHYKNLDVKSIRNKAGLSQDQFAIMIGISVRTLQNWEQGHRKPEGPAKALLTIFNNDPKHAFKALHHQFHK